MFDFNKTSNPRPPDLKEFNTETKVIIIMLFKREMGKRGYSTTLLSEINQQCMVESEQRTVHSLKSH